MLSESGNGVTANPANAFFYFMTGALAARILGILVDGTDPKQWLWVAVEAVVMAVASPR